MQFEFATSQRIIFGAGRLSQVGELAAELGKKALVVSGASGQRGEIVSGLLAEKGVDRASFRVSGEPTVEVVRQGVAFCREQKCDMVVAIGGGSVLDTGKAIAALSTNPGDIYEYLEVIGQGKPLTKSPLPFIAIPTTSGTGSEATRNAVIGSPEHRVKVSLRHVLMLPRVALIDPELTYSMPPAVTASSGMDALTQLIEPFVCNMPTPITDAICRDGLQRVGRSLLRAYRQGDHREAREDMALAGLFGGIALANARLGAVHGFSGPIGGMSTGAHGAICARLLPIVMEFNLRALRQRGDPFDYLARYDEVARLLTGDPGAKADDGVEWVYYLREELAIPPLRNYGLREDDLDVLVENSAKANSMKGNPVPLTLAEMREILVQAL